MKESRKSVLIYLLDYFSKEIMDENLSRVPYQIWIQANLSLLSSSTETFIIALDIRKGISDKGNSHEKVVQGAERS